MIHRLSNLLGAITAWLCLAPVVFARTPLSMPGTFAPALTPAHHIGNLPLFMIWASGGVFLIVGGLFVFAPLRFRGRKSDQLSGRAHFYRSTETDIAWTVIPLLVLVLFLV